MTVLPRLLTTNDIGGTSRGAADEVLQTNAGGTANEWAKIDNANVASAAAIEVSKLANGSPGEILRSTGDGPQWGLDTGPLTVDSLTSLGAIAGPVTAPSLPLFTAVARGAVPPSGGGTANYMRADGTWAAPTASVAISTTSVAFTDGDTARRVTVTDAAVTAASKIIATVRRPDTTNDSEDRGYLYIPNVVKCASGSFDVLIACLDIGGMDPTMNPPNETITLCYQVA